jgi:hypothetical protein
MLGAGPVLMLLCIVCAADATARSIDGRIYVTYQNTSGTTMDNAYLSQNLETTIRDRLFEKNNLMLSLYFDNTSNLRRSLTTRRYYGRLQLSGLYYDLNIHYSPKQKITPLEVETSREITDKQVNLDINVPSLPNLRLYYAKKRQFTEGVFSGDSRSMRADLDYKYKFIEVGLNRWQDKSSNSSRNRTTVTGGRVRMARSFIHAINVNTGYEYILTQTERIPGTKMDVSNHTLSSLVSARYKSYISGSVSIVSRWLDSKNAEESTGRNHTFSARVNFFPASPVRIDLARDYIESRQDTSVSISDYATAQLVMTGKLGENTNGRAQAARRFVIRSSRGAIPANILYFSLDSRIFRDLSTRAELNISQRDVKEYTKGKYQINSTFEIYAKPRRTLQLRTSVQYYKYSPTFSLLKNNRVVYSMTATYFPAGRFHIGVDAQRSMITSGQVQTNDAVTVNSSIAWSNRSNFNISYGFNTIDKPGEPADDESTGNRNTLTLQSQFWITGSAVLAVNYSRQAKKGGRAPEFLTVSYRQNY